MASDTHNNDPKTNKSLLKYVRGLPFPNVPWFFAENIEAAMDYRSLDDDILICSYPKTGTTWMQYIIWQILYKGESYPPFQDVTYKLAPYMEMTNIETVEALKPPRFYKNHLPYNLMTVNDKAKYIYVYRNPADTLTSFYHFNNNINQTVIDFDEHFENFLSGNISYGDYFNHVLSFYSHKNDPNLLLVSYEDLHADKRGQVLRIAKFIGEQYHRALLDDERLQQKILEVTTFEYMKKNLNLTVADPNGEPLNVEMFRKGIVGDGKQTLSTEQRERLRSVMMQKMKDTDVLEQWIDC